MGHVDEGMKCPQWLLFLREAMWDSFHKERVKPQFDGCELGIV